MSGTASRISAVAVCILVLLQSVHGFYIPGVSPTSYAHGAPVSIKVNSLTSITRVMPMPWYSMPWCAPSKADRKKYRKAQNLGEILYGDRIEISLFRAEVLVNSTCRTLCDPTPLNEKQRKLLTRRIEENYRGNLVLDNLPVAEEGTGKQGLINSAVATGFPLGISAKYTANQKTVVHNHLEFTILYHADAPMTTTAKEAETYRIVGFQVTPISVDHTKDACGDKFNPDNAQAIYSDSESITWSYSVHWVESDIEWSTRWDVYLKSSKAEARIHWFSIVNSLLIVLLLAAIVGFLLVRLLRRDLSRYNDPESLEEEREETGWKLVHGDVFRKPAAAGLLAVYMGTGAQLLGMCFATLAFACLGFLSPANRGALITALVFLFVLLGSYSGYTTARFAKMWKMKNWKIIFATGLYFPGQIFLCYFLLNFVHWGADAASATPALTMFTLFAMWLCVSVPLVLLGAAIGYKREAIEPPRKVSTIPRTIPPQPWYLCMPQVAILPGILPFGAAFIEIVFILSSIWQGRVYYVFGFLMLVFIILIITCALCTVVMTYFQLVNLDYNWWWRSFLTSGSFSLWLFLYCIFYYITALNIRAWWSSVLYFGYMAMVSYFFFVLTGAIGFLASFAFVNKIYSSLKVD